MGIESKLSDFENFKLEEMLRAAERNPFADPRAQAMAVKLIEEGVQLSERAGEEIGRLFIAEILRIDPKESNGADIVEALAGIKGEKEGIANFWKGVSEIAPQLVGEEDLPYLIASDGSGEAAFAMIGKIVLGPRGFLHSTLNDIFHHGAPA